MFYVNGVMAQLVARLNGIQKVRGSNPLGSTKTIKSLLSVDFFCFGAKGLFVLYTTRLYAVRTPTG